MKGGFLCRDLLSPFALHNGSRHSSIWATRVPIFHVQCPPSLTQTKCSKPREYHPCVTLNGCAEATAACAHGSTVSKAAKTSTAGDPRAQRMQRYLCATIPYAQLRLTTKEKGSSACASYLLQYWREKQTTYCDDTKPQTAINKILGLLNLSVIYIFADDTSAKYILGRAVPLPILVQSSPVYC
jgi:hypothetical protein